MKKKYLVLQIRKEKSIKNGNPLSLAMTFWAALYGVVENIARNPDLPVPKYEWFVDILRNNERHI